MLISKEINVNQSNILKVNDIVKYFFINAEVLYIILNTIGKYRNLLHKLCLSYLKSCAYFFDRFILLTNELLFTNELKIKFNVFSSILYLLVYIKTSKFIRLFHICIYNHQ